MSAKASRAVRTGPGVEHVEQRLGLGRPGRRRRRGPASMAGCLRSRSSASACRASSVRSAAEQLEQAGVGGVGRGLGHQHRQRRHALAQVGAGRLAGLVGLGGDVEDVVGELEGRADDLAVRRERLDDLGAWRRRTARRSGRRWRSASRSCRRRPRGSARAGPRPGPGVTVSRIWPSTSRVNVCAWMRTASGPRSAVSSEDFAKRKSPVRIATWLSQRALAESAPRRRSASSMTSSW